MELKDKQYLYDMYNATSTDDGNGGVETYENWLERQLLSRLKTIIYLQNKRQELISLRESIYRSNQKKGILKPTNEMKIISKKVGLLSDILNQETIGID